MTAETGTTYINIDSLTIQQVTAQDLEISCTILLTEIVAVQPEEDGSQSAQAY